MRPQDRLTSPRNVLILSYCFAPKHCDTRIANPLLKPFSHPVTKTLENPYSRWQPVRDTPINCPCHDGIRYVIKLLKYISQAHRNHKTYDQFRPGFLSSYRVSYFYPWTVPLFLLHQSLRLFSLIYRPRVIIRSISPL